jgi:hypothetical protein
MTLQQVKLPSGTIAMLTPGPRPQIDMTLALLLAAMWRIGYIGHN